MDSDWSDEQKAPLKNEREKLDEEMAELKRNVEALVIEEKQLKADMEREEDAEEDAKFQRLEERAIVRLRNKQATLKERLNELEKEHRALTQQENQLNALIEHEKYPEWLELKKKRDTAIKEVERLESEMKKLI
jgi:predicted ribonuclease toxin of YeeF-YezG toxin-antitoxin module